MVIVDLTFSHLIKKNKSGFSGEFTVWNDIYNSAISCDIAVYGSSRAWRHIDPSILNDSLSMQVYNFGADGQRFNTQYIRHEMYTKNNPLPKYIIHSVDLWTLDVQAEMYNHYQFLPYMFWNQNLKNHLENISQFKTLDFYVPMIRYYGTGNAHVEAFIKDMLKRDEGLRVNGFKGSDLKFNVDVVNSNVIIDKSNSSQDKIDIKRYEEFILECKKMDIELILVYSPEYKDSKNSLTNRDSVIAMYSKLCKKYDLIFLDYTLSPLCENKENFFNMTHLNKVGASLFSQMLAHDLKSNIVAK